MRRRVTFTEDGARRIVDAVRGYEQANRNQPPIKFRQVDEGGESVRLCKTTSVWAFNTAATLDLWEAGDPLDEQLSVHDDTTLTLEAYNKLFDVAACVWVLVGQARNGKWYLLAASGPTNEEGCVSPNIGGQDLTTIPGYDSAKSQALTHNASGCLAWVDIESCT